MDVLTAVARMRDGNAVVRAADMLTGFSSRRRHQARRGISLPQGTVLQAPRGSHSWNIRLWTPATARPVEDDNSPTLRCVSSEVQPRAAPSLASHWTASRKRSIAGRPRRSRSRLIRSDGPTGGRPTVSRRSTWLARKEVRLLSLRPYCAIPHKSRGFCRLFTENFVCLLFCHA